MRPETQAAISAAQAVLPLLRARTGADARQDKAVLDFATDTDVAVENHLVDTLRRAFPDYGIFAEESGGQGSDSTFWSIDLDRHSASPLGWECRGLQQLSALNRLRMPRRQSSQSRPCSRPDQ